LKRKHLISIFFKQIRNLNWHKKKPLIEQGKHKLAMQFAFSLIRKKKLIKKISSFQNAKSRLGFGKGKLAMQFGLSLNIF
jgi:hypothetical protein